MDSTDLEVVNVLVFQQLLESVESESWAEAAMALYKLYDIEAGQDFLDQDEVDEQQLLAALPSACAVQFQPIQDG